MRRGHYRLTLPLFLGCVSGLLMTWDLHNNRVIASMGMAWDTGAPVWPYEASWIAQVSINAPAYVLSTPLFFLFNLQTATQRYWLFFPVIIAWWWWLGRRIDSGLLPLRAERHRWAIGAALVIGASIFYCIGVLFVLDDTRFWSEYGVLAMRLLRTAGPMLWCFSLAVTLTISAFRVIGLGRSPAHQEVHRNR
jgi:hypothetical protein